MIIKLCFNDCKSKLLLSSLFIVFRTFKLRLRAEKMAFLLRVFTKTVPVTFTKLFLQRQII